MLAKYMMNCEADLGYSSGYLEVYVEVRSQHLQGTVSTMIYNSPKNEGESSISNDISDFTNFLDEIITRCQVCF